MPDARPGRWRSETRPPSRLRLLLQQRARTGRAVEMIGRPPRAACRSPRFLSEPPPARRTCRFSRRRPCRKPRHLPDPGSAGWNRGMAYTFSGLRPYRRWTRQHSPEENKPWHDDRCPRTTGWPPAVFRRELGHLRGRAPRRHLVFARFRLFI